ncbi:ROK family protein [Neobacillus niacini]|uniref:ROK family protein n=1 Tax=Neobacillus niacini TaxID=86668 RepID=UPI003000E996
MNTIGIDIGGTKVKAGIINHEGQILSLIEEQTNKQELMNQLLSLIERLLHNDDFKIEGIGIATAGRVDVENGSVLYATSNLPGWTGIKVKEMVEERFSIPTVVDNDANCAAYAEMEIGSAIQVENFICITIGTGVGAGIILNGNLHRGKNGGAGEIGHMVLIPNGRQCNCGKRGCWEQYVSGTALTLDIKEESTFLNQTILPENIFKHAYDSNPIAVKIVERFIDNLAVGIASLQDILDLDCFVLGGGVIDSSPYWWDQLVNKLKTITNQSLIIRKAKLKNNAGMLGAALMACTYATMKLKVKG